jgi:hypothetical protein
VTITPNNEKAKQVGTSEGLLVETYGLPLLSYLCATDEDQMHRRLDETGELSPAAETVLTTHLLAIAQQVASRLTEQPNFPRTFALEFLSESTSDTGPSIGNAIRLAAGGALPENRLASIPADEVKTFITRMAIDVYPALLVPSDLDWMQPRISLFRHPARESLQAAVHADESIGRMYPHEDPPLGRRGYVYTSLGHGRTIQDSMFGEMLILSSWEIAKLTTRTPSVDDLIDTIHQSIDTIRAAARGKDTTVRALIAFTGFKTVGNTQVTTPWGTFRPLTEWERGLAPPGLEGELSGSDDEGKAVRIAYAGEMVLETQLPYALLIHLNPLGADVSEPWPHIIGRRCFTAPDRKRPTCHPPRT